MLLATWIFLPFALCALPLSESEAISIGKKIWRNECRETIEGLVTWNAGEDFASLGIGHFIWYPIGKQGIFTETFPDLLRFLKENNVKFPYWLSPHTPCPWRTREAFDKDKRSPKRKDLLNLLASTTALQAQFLIKRFVSSQDKLTQGLTASERAHVEKQLTRLFATAQGLFILIDYMNFKGDGLSDAERYQGHGWGLQQVLTFMPDNTDDPIAEFISSAKRVLARRVELAPPSRQESRWLAGWFNRLDSYLE